ncbi:S9 family peptidase [Kribbella jejuensis]|uniref:Dipeptidyl aminopeptidase/acylaminoacyl peptidase n=1 Tax=Kribbella jejuensis TaxID=236068 RepID=A0A542EUW0_9ACTN|nr:S9 family peptidase [Kribbella jejuensis]TQJ19137.1 dipeptidyl aminopeptidase/acylaminoacyl peptidase [Kribbella jejuensis]
MLLTTLFSLPTTLALDIDDEGRMLVLYDGTGTRQVNEVAPDGTWRALTDLGDTCRSAWFVPGSSQVVVEHDTGGDERGQLSILDLADDGLPALTPLVHDAEYIHHLVAARAGRILYTTNRRNGVDFDLVTRDLATGRDTVLYDAGGWVMAVDPSPDDKWVVLSKASSTANSMQLLLVDTSSRAVTELTPEDAHNDQGPVAWLPDSSAFVVSSNAGRDRKAIRRYDVADAVWTDVLVDDARDLAAWPSPDGEHQLIAVLEDGEVTLALHRLEDGTAIAPVGLPAGGCAALTMATPDPIWSADGSFAAITYNSPVVPPTVYRFMPNGELTAINQVEVPAELQHPESLRVPSFDGEQVPAFVFRPTAPDLGSTVVHVHGGPEAAAMRIWSPIISALAGEGHTVVVPNVRGSAGYGKRWYSLDDRQLRLDSVKDLAAINAWLPTIGADPKRAALWGGSYGGYMVLAGVSFQPELWAAGVDIVGIASLVTFLENTSDYRRAMREREYGYLATDREFLESASPLSRVDDIRAPLFVIHGANDPRVPLSEAEQITEALTSRGVPCRLLVYPDEGHGLAKLKNRLDAYPQAFSFLREHLA